MQSRNYFQQSFQNYPIKVIISTSHNSSSTASNVLFRQETTRRVEFTPRMRNARGCAEFVWCLARVSPESRVGREFYLLVCLSPKLGTTRSLNCSSDQFNQDFVGPVTRFFFFVDEDECRTEMANCGQHAYCTNTPGFYNCICFYGETKNNRKRPCSKRREDICKNVKCDERTRCTLDGDCDCKSGFLDLSKVQYYHHGDFGSWSMLPAKCVLDTRCSVITLLAFKAKLNYICNCLNMNTKRFTQY